MLSTKYGFARILGVTLICSLLLAFISGCVRAPAPPPERQATLMVEPASGKAAAAIKIKGSNFLPDEEVETVLIVGDILHGLGTEKADQVVANKAGVFEVDSGIPVQTQPGTYTIKARGKKGSVATFTIQVVK